MLIVFAAALILSWGANAGTGALMLWARTRAPARPRRLSHGGAIADQMR